MAGEQAFSPSKSMDEKKGQCPQQFDEVWSELHNPFGKEFDLPNLSDPLSSDASEKNADMADSTFGLIDVPIGIDETILQATIDPSSGGIPTESLQALEMQIGLAKENNLFEVPIFDGISFDLDLNRFLTGKKPDFFNMFGLPRSFASRDPETNPTDGHISADDDQSKGILGSPNKSSSGSNDFTFDNSAFSSSPRNEVACDPITNPTNVRPLGLNNSAPTMEIPVVVPTPRVTQTQSSPSTNFLGTGGNGQAFGLSPFQVGHQSSSCLSGENGISNHGQGNSGGGEVFHITGWRPFFEPVNFHETETKGNNFSIHGKGKEKEKEKILIPSALGGEGWITGQRPFFDPVNFDGTETKGNNLSIHGEGKEKVSIPSALGGEGLITGQPVNFRETETKGNDFSIHGKRKEVIPIPSEEIELGQASKRLKQDNVVAENNNGISGQAFSSYSSPSSLWHDVVTRALGGGLEDIIPSPGTLRPRQLVFKEPLDSKKPGN